MAPAKEKPRDRVLDDDELARIITAARQINSPYGGIVELLALTGQRRGSCFANEKDLPSRGVPLAPEWERLRRGISHFRNRAVLSSLMRYCSGNSISPEAVDASVLDSLMRYRAASTALAADWSLGK
jgi:hypothetical protein